VVALGNLIQIGLNFGVVGTGGMMVHKMSSCAGCMIYFIIQKIQENGRIISSSFPSFCAKYRRNIFLRYVTFLSPNKKVTKEVSLRGGFVQSPLLWCLLFVLFLPKHEKAIS
jgi:hypothetical protein